MIKKYVELEFGKDTMIISYPHGHGGHFKDTAFWMGIINGEVEDYHLQSELIRQAEEQKIEWVVLKTHRAPYAISINKKSKGAKIISYMI